MREVQETYPKRDEKSIVEEPRNAFEKTIILVVHYTIQVTFFR